jgi:hypothetical protein
MSLPDTACLRTNRMKATTTRIASIKPDYYLDPFDVEEAQDCGACDGQGYDEDDAPCIACGGEGYY